MTTIFVFGSNTQGRHGAGAARHARRHYGAIYGQSSGRQGSSYGIVTKELRSDHPPVTLDEIRAAVEDFIRYALAHPHDTFIVTAIGCGLGGFATTDIAPLFRDAPRNVFVSPHFITPKN